MLKKTTAFMFAAALTVAPLGCAFAQGAGGGGDGGGGSGAGVSPGGTTQPAGSSSLQRMQAEHATPNTDPGTAMNGMNNGAGTTALNGPGAYGQTGTMGSAGGRGGAGAAGMTGGAGASGGSGTGGAGSGAAGG